MIICVIGLMYFGMLQLHEVKQCPCEWCCEEEYAVFCETCHKHLCAICNRNIHHKGIMSKCHIRQVDISQNQISSDSTLLQHNTGPWSDVEVK